MNMNYAMYLRKSRADLELEAIGQGETLARHHQILSDLASRYDITQEQITIFREVVSGESIADRPEMQRLLNDVYLKKYAGVLCMEVERLARGNTKDQGEVADAFQYSGTKIITPMKVYDPQNEFDQEYFEFGLFMSRREYKTIKRRMEAGRLQSFREGNYVGSLRPYGYDIKRISKKERILFPVPEEAKVVKMIFNWFTVDRMTPGQISKQLTRLSIPTVTGKAEWNRGTVADILRNDHYAGNVRWNRRKSTKEFAEGKLEAHKRRLSPDSYEVRPGKHDAIISQQQFDLAQSLFTGSVPVKANTTLTNPLAGLLKCADCGKSIAYQSYECKGGHTSPRFAHKDSIACVKKSCSSVVLMSALVEALTEAINDFRLKMSICYCENEKTQWQNTLSALETELAKNEKRKARLFDSWEADDGTYTKDEFIQRKLMYDSNIDNLKKQIQDLKNANPEPVDYSDKIKTLHQMIDMIQDETVSAKAKNTFLKENIECILYDSVDLGRNKGCKPILDVYLK